MEKRFNKHIQVRTNVSKKEHIQAIEQLEYCTVCHGKLLFSHQVDQIKNVVLENSKCPTCGHESSEITFVLN